MLKNLILLIFTLYLQAEQLTYTKFEDNVKKLFMKQCTYVAGPLAKDTCPCAFQYMNKVYFTEENKKSLQVYIDKLNQTEASLMEKRFLNQFATEAASSADGFVSICFVEGMQKAEAERKVKQKKEEPAPKDLKQEKIYEEKVQKILAEAWQKTEDTQHGNSAKILIHITPKGEFSAKIVSLSYSNDFNNKVKTFLHNMGKTSFPPYNNGPFFEMRITLSDVNQ